MPSSEKTSALLFGMNISSAVGLRDRAIVAVMTHTFARVSAVVALNVEDYFAQKKRWWLRLNQKNGKIHEMPCHHKLEAYLHAYIAKAGIAGDDKGPLFRVAIRKTKKLGPGRISRKDVWYMVRRRAIDAGIDTKVRPHTFRATGITDYLTNGGRVEVAQRMAGHPNAKTTASTTGATMISAWVKSRRLESEGGMPDLGTDERRVTIEAIATLCHIKRAMVDLLLKPAGVPEEAFRPHLYRRDEMGRVLSKRQIAPLILDACEHSAAGNQAIRRILEIAATWTSFHLADNEYAARATVQKARELLGTIELMEAREAQARELARQEELATLAREKGELLKRHSELLLMMFDDLARSDDPQHRGYLLQELLNRLFVLHEIPVFRAFTRNAGGEQIDGAFIFEGWHYIVECRWREKLADIRQLDGLLGQVGRSGKQVMGIFLSINGWSEHVPELLKQNSDKCIFLMDGYDLRCVLALEADFRDLLLAKLAHLNLASEPWLGVKSYLERLRDS